MSDNGNINSRATAKYWHSTMDTHTPTVAGEPLWTEQQTWAQLQQIPHRNGYKGHECGSEISDCLVSSADTERVWHQLLMAGHFAPISSLLSASTAVHVTVASLFSASIKMWG